MTIIHQTVALQRQFVVALINQKITYGYICSLCGYVLGLILSLFPPLKILLNSLLKLQIILMYRQSNEECLKFDFLNKLKVVTLFITLDQLFSHKRDESS